MGIMEQLISDNIRDLCTYTTVDESLLLECQGELLKDNMKDTINSKSTPLDKASAFYTLMKKRPDKDLQALIQALKDSGNARAAEILENALKTAKKEPVPNESNSSVQGSSSSVNTYPATAFRIAQKICADATIIQRWADLQEPLKVTPADFQAMQRGIANGTSRLNNVIKDMIAIWVGRTGKKATVASLMTILNENEFEMAAELLEAFPGDEIIK